MTVCVSCKGKTDLLRENLSALSRQNLKKDLWSTVLLIPEGVFSERFLESLFSDFSDLCLKTFVLPQSGSLEGLRNQAFEKIPSGILFFIDEDVILQNPFHLKTLVSFHQRNPSWAVIGGGYVSSTECSFWGRAYNLVSRLWMEENPGFVPAGNLSVKTARLTETCRFKSPLRKGFGGEEIYFFNQLKSLNRPFFARRELTALHIARHTFREFLYRAFLHGQSYGLQSSFGLFHGTERRQERQSVSVSRFFSQRETVPIKVTALFYLFLVRLTGAIYRLFGRDQRFQTK